MQFRTDHLSLAVADLDAALAFFTAALSYRIAFLERDMTKQIASMLGLAEAACDLAQLDPPSDGPKLELIAFRTGEATTAPERPTRPGAGHVALATGEFDAVLARVRAHGARLLGHITRFERGRAVYLTTDFGAFIELQEDPTAAEEAA